MFSELDPKFQKSWEEHVEKVIATTSDVISESANSGWFLPSLRELRLRDTGDIRRLSKKSQDERDTYFCEFYGTRLSHIQEVLIDKYPMRELALNQAFEAHGDQKYFLSTSVFLSQADGIFQDLTLIKHGVYSQKQEKNGPIVRRFLGGADIDDYMLAFLRPLWSKNALNRNEIDRRGNPFIINRHSVLHGISYDYGTEINSLKSISFLFFIGTAVQEMIADINEQGIKIYPIFCD